jgi:hypothetical protein
MSAASATTEVVKSSGRGAKPGERRGGRARGTPNKATADIKALAAVHAPAAMKELARLAVQAQSEAARVAAIKELLDRGYGKARQPVDHGGADGGAIVHVVQLVPLS